jgi:hypothetical protein
VVSSRQQTEVVYIFLTFLLRATCTVHLNDIGALLKENVICSAKSINAAVGVTNYLAS